MLGILAPHLLAVVLVAAVVIAIPGPSVLFIVSRAIASGRRVAVLSVLGNSTGEYVQVAAVAFGMGALAREPLALFAAMRLVGGAYLIYLAIKTFRERGHLAALWQAPTEIAADRASFLQAATVGVSNPKTVVCLAAILPGFTSPAAGSVPLQILFRGLTFSTIAILSDTTWALAAGTLRTRWARTPQRLRLVGGPGASPPWHWARACWCRPRPNRRRHPAGEILFRYQARLSLGVARTVARQPERAHPGRINSGVTPAATDPLRSLPHRRPGCGQDAWFLPSGHGSALLSCNSKVRGDASGIVSAQLPWPPAEQWPHRGDALDAGVFAPGSTPCPASSRPRRSAALRPSKPADVGDIRHHGRHRLPRLL